MNHVFTNTRTSIQYLGAPTHLREVLRIEEMSFDEPWTHADFIHTLRTPGVHGMIAQRDARVGAFILYHGFADRVDIIHMATHPAKRRCGFGTALIEALRRCCRRKALRGVVRESNLDAQLFFRAMGFRAVGIERRYFTGREDGYEMLREAV